MRTTAEIESSHPGRIVVSVPYMLKERVKAVPGARWDAKEKLWHVPLSWPSALALRAEFPDLVIGPELTEWGWSQSKVKEPLNHFRHKLTPTDSMEGKLTDVPGVDPGFVALYGYQKVGAMLIEKAGSYLLFDETGTGKSRTALAGIAMLAMSYGFDITDPGESRPGVFPILIVAPKSMLRTWRTEIEGFFPDYDIRVVEGTPTKVRKLLEPGADFYIVSYDTARLNSRQAHFPTVTLSEKDKAPGALNDIGISTIIADECHRIKNPKSKRTRALWWLGDRARYRIGLTGSPIQDTPEDLWSVLRFVAPNEYPVKTGYIERYCEAEFNHWGGREIKGLRAANRDEFFANLNTRTRRITKEVALPFLPPKVYETRWVTLPPKLRKEYDSMERRMIADADSMGIEEETDPVIVAGSTLEKAGRLIQLANSGGAVDADGKFHMAKDASPKVDSFMDDIKEGDYDGHQVVVFSDSRLLIEKVAEKMRKADLDLVMITGDVTGEDRQDAMDIFQNGEAQFMLLTRAGGEGITLTNADIMVRLVRSWSYTVHMQAEDRVHRIGSESHDSISYIDYIAADTIEEGQMARLAGKAERAEEVLRDKELLDMIRRSPW